MNKHFADGEPNHSGLRGRASLLLLVLVNPLPLVEVLLFDRDLAGFMVLHWSGNLVPGFYTLLKMLTKLPRNVSLPPREHRKLASNRTG
ncbi:MAG: hypothetical protein KDI21_12575 [Halieaceae bacterium]|nr:hypothetical protein [Halieaceae bacterium]